MVYTQMVEIPAEREIFLKLPETAPIGRVTITVSVAETCKNNALEEAAKMAAVEYAVTPELTEFCALDGEDFFETR